MWDPYAKLMLRLCLITFIYLTVTDCYLRPVTTTPPLRAFERKRARVLPQEFLHNDRNILNSVVIPNSDFCTEMILKPEDHYLVLPWWYNYCQDLKEKHTKGIQGNINFDTIHKYILEEVQLYKKRQNEKNIKLSEMEKELIAFKNA